VDSTKQENKSKQQRIKERLGEASFAPAAVLGAFTSFFASATGNKVAPAKEVPQQAPLVQGGLSSTRQASVPAHLENQYARSLVLGGEHAGGLFRQSLSSLAVGPSDRIFVLGDGEIRVFDPDGKRIRVFQAPEGALCLAVDAGSRVYVGLKGRIEIYSETGNPGGGFDAGENGQPAFVTAIKVIGQDLLAADAAGKLIRRYDFRGKQLGVIGMQGKIRGFMLPNKSLDFAVDAKGVIYAADSGRHRVSSWNPDGSLKGQFGKFGLANPEDFVGCCNPVNLAVLPGGNVVVAEKVATRVKVYNPEGRLLAVIGSENFDPKCVHLHLAVDSKGRILVADPVRREVQIFSASGKSGDSKSV
jgi:hypothetical protein